MFRSDGTKQRIIERNKYKPLYNSTRDQRIVGKNGKSQTFKMKGDIVFHENGRVREVAESGWD